MTPEQLDEIEKLAEAATPGPWDADVGVDFDDGCPIIEWYACGPPQESREFDEDGLPSLGAAKGLAEKDAVFIVAMREHALPLVKALREARAALEQVSSDDRMSEAQITAAITEAAKERDEAQAEVERLREAVRQVHAMTGRGVDWAAFPGVAATTLREIHKITKGMVK